MINLNELTKDELMLKCKEYNIKKYKSKNKNELIELVENYVKNNENKIKYDTIDLYKINKGIIKTMIKDEHIIDIIKSKYNKSQNKEENVYNFIYSYINGIKM